jgi:DNA-binding beta-propeller fold protein YncE
MSASRPPRTPARPARPPASLLLAAFGAAVLACSEDAAGPDAGPLAGRAFVVNSLGGTLSVVGRRSSDGRLEARNDVAELGAESNAVTLAVGEGVVAVPTQTSRLLVFEEATLAHRCSATLPVASSPAGVALGGGDAFVTLLETGAVARVDIAACQVEAIAPVGPGPVDVEVLGDELLVVVGNIDFAAPGIPPRLGPSYVAFVDALTLEVRDTVGTGGENAQFAELDREGDLVVVNSGDFDGGNGTVSVIDPVARRLTAGPFPIGDFPGDLAIGPDGRAYVTSFNDGLYVFDSGGNRVLRDASNPLFAPGPLGARRGSSGVAVDRRGNVLSVHFGDLPAPGKVFLFEAGEALVDSAGVGVGPFAIRVESSAR